MKNQFTIDSSHKDPYYLYLTISGSHLSYGPTKYKVRYDIEQDYLNIDQAAKYADDFYVMTPLTSLPVPLINLILKEINL